MSLDNMSTATKMDPFYAPRAAVVVMGRPRRDVSERVPTIGACRTIPCIGPMHPEVMRAHSGPASSVAIGRLLNRGAAYRWATFETIRLRGYLGPLARPVRPYERTL